MRTFWLILLAPLSAWAQFPPPQLAGVLLERDADVAAGELAVRASDNQVYRFQFDAGSAVQVDGFKSSVFLLKPGEKVEVDSDVVPGSLLRYARAIRAVAPPTPKMTLADTRLHSPAVHPLPDRLLPTGNLTFAGVVSRLNAQSLVLRTRLGEQTLLIRKDTRYIANGDTVEAATLQPNMRVFVRAGTNLYEQVEAYQVIWGKILEVKH